MNLLSIIKHFWKTVGTLALQLRSSRFLFLLLFISDFLPFSGSRSYDNLHSCSSCVFVMLTKVPLNEVNVRPSITPAYAPPPSTSAHVESHPGSSGKIIVDVCRYGLCIHVITGHKNDLTRKSVCVCTGTTVKRAGIDRRGKYSKQNATV